MIASRCRSDLAPDCTTSPPFGVNGSRKNGFVVTVSTRALNGGRGASCASGSLVTFTSNRGAEELVALGPDETVLNMTTAKALGLDVPTSILLSADEPIE